jgi:hypothetical protein
MNSAKYVSGKLEEMKQSGEPLQSVAWQFGLLCVGWAYVFGARGEYCTPSNRRKYTQARAQNIRQSKPPVKGLIPGIAPGVNGIRPARKHGFLIAVGSRIGFCYRSTVGS